MREKSRGLRCSGSGRTDSTIQEEVGQEEISQGVAVSLCRQCGESVKFKRTPTGAWRAEEHNEPLLKIKKLPSGMRALQDRTEVGWAWALVIFAKERYETMVEIDYEEGKMASQQADNERDMVIRGVFAEYQIEVVFDRSVPVGLDAKYDLRDKKTEKMFIIHDYRAIPCGSLLAVDIRRQLQTHGVTRI